MHTNEPWTRNEHRLESAREHGVANDGWCVAEFYGPDAKANMRRTKACVNAMAGVSDPAAFVAKVRELMAGCNKHENYVPIFAKRYLHELAAMLPPEPKEA